MAGDMFSHTVDEGAPKIKETTCGDCKWMKEERCKVNPPQAKVIANDFVGVWPIVDEYDSSCRFFERRWKGE